MVEHHHAQTGDVLTGVTKLDPAIVKAMPRVIFAESADTASMKPHLDAALKYGLISKAVTGEELLAPELRK